MFLHQYKVVGNEQIGFAFHTFVSGKCYNWCLVMIKVCVVCVFCSPEFCSILISDFGVHCFVHDAE